MLILIGNVIFYSSIFKNNAYNINDKDFQLLNAACEQTQCMIKNEFEVILR